MSATINENTFGLGLPQVLDGGSPTPAELGQLAVQAEQLGFARLWVSELTSAPMLDPLHVLTYIAGRTERIGLGVAVLLVPLRIPLQLARDTATLDRLSEGRLVLGVGLGSNRDLYRAYGLPAEGRVQRFEAALDALTGLWVSEAPDDDRFWDLSDAVTISPLQQPRPPLWFGARRGDALRRVVERGDGWIVSGSAPADEFRLAREQVARLLTERDRDPDAFPVAARVYLAVTDDAAAARARMAAWFGANYGRPGMADEVGVVGDADRVAAHLATLLERGINHLLLNPVFDGAEQLEALGTDVLPQLPRRPRPLTDA